MEIKSRAHHLDFVATLMILYMIYTHICQRFGLCGTNCSYFLQRIFSCFMAWFFFKGGMFYKRNSFLVTLKNSARRLIMPYIVWSIIGFAFSTIKDIMSCSDYNFFVSLRHNIASVFYNGSPGANLPLWFLLTLFLVRIIFHICDKVKLPVILVLFVSILIPFGCYLVGGIRPLWIVNSFLGVFFYTLGYLLRYYQYKMFVGICCICFSIILTYVCFSFVDFRSNKLSCGFYFVWVVNSVLSIISYNFIFYYVEENFKLFFSCIWGKALLFIGENSMLFYVIHWPILTILSFFLK